MEGQAGQARGQDVLREGEGVLAKAVSPQQLAEIRNLTLWAMTSKCTDLKKIGCVMAWTIVNADFVSQIQGNTRFLKMIFTSGVQHRAGRRSSVLPLREGELRELIGLLREKLWQHIVEDDFSNSWGERCWTLVSIYGCNFLHGVTSPMEGGRWSKAERRVAQAVGQGVNRFLDHGPMGVTVDPNLESDLKSRKVNYRGEEVGTCKRLTLAQVLPALPPKEHGGSIRAVDFVSEHTKRLLNNPEWSILEDDGRKLPKLKGIVHADPHEMQLIADELVERGVCEWTPLKEVVQYRGEYVLNGLFGVEKSSTIQDGRPVLRLIMNLVGSNAIMRQFLGAIKELPAITAWMSTVLEEGQELRVWQSDMSNAFYLFQIPKRWVHCLAFNVIRDMDDPITGKRETMALGCRVLPMGWLSSVSVMQEISQNLLRYRGIEPLGQLVRNKPVPPWMVGIIEESRESSRLWWHIYLDNFAGGQTITYQDELKHGNHLHDLAELAWKEAGVVSSVKKQKRAEAIAYELGACIDGSAQYIGGSAERFIKLIHATFWVLSEPLLSKKVVQVIAGRWIHLMQFRRPTMGVLEKTWQFIGKTQLEPGIHQMVRRELFQCICLAPLMHTHLGAGISELMTASDASNTGGAVGVARELTAEGKDFVRASRTVPYLPEEAPILLISLFGGIGGCFRAYDILGVKVAAMVHVDIHKPANRVISRRWPQAEIYEDVRDFDLELLRSLLGRYPTVKEIHLWAGFPCNDLSSANALGRGLDGPSSSLFYEFVRIRDMITAEVHGYIEVKTTGENVASMPRSECDEISPRLGLRPYFLDSMDAVPMRRPRLCWCSESLEGSFDDIEIWPEENWKRVYAPAPYPKLEQWIEPGVVWEAGEEGEVLPTCMKSIPRSKPPVKPAGIERCDSDSLGRYAADSFRYPPYQYLLRFVFWTPKETWRLVNAEEKELLMGYGWKHTALCYSASKIKQSYRSFDDERNSLLGDSFNVYSFVIPAMALCRNFVQKVSYKHIAMRMGMAPGFRSSIRTLAPLARKLQYGFAEFQTKAGIQDLNRFLLSRTNHTGSDVRIATGEVLNPKSHPRQGVDAKWWSWEPAFKVKWKHKDHINLLELRSILLSARYHVSHLQSFNMRICHITDSYICLSVASKGRTSSHQLGRLLRQLNAFLLAHNLYLILAHVDSSDNPTDVASRSLEA